MRRRLGNILILLAIVGLFDAHLMIAQSWAWATMINDRVPEQGIEAALESTFSGEKPCPLCRSVQKEKQRKHQKEPAPLPEEKPIAKAYGSSCGPIRSFRPDPIRLPFLLRDMAWPEHEIKQPDPPPPRWITASSSDSLDSMRSLPT